MPRLVCITPMLLLFTLPGLATASETLSDIAARTYVAGELGYAALARDTESDDHRDDTLALAFEGGVHVRPSLAVGVRVGGWTIQPSNFNKPGEGSSISIMALTLRHHPDAMPRLLLRGNLHASRYTNEAPGAQDAKGSGFAFGVGYEFPVATYLRLTPMLDLSRGKLTTDASVLMPEERTRYTAISLGVELRYLPASARPQSQRHH